MKKDISFLEWEKYSNIPLSKELLYSDGFPANGNWLLPQVLAFIGTKIPLSKNEDGKYSATLSLAKIAETFKSGSIQFSNGLECTASKLWGIMRVLNVNPRGNIMPANTPQSSKEGARYCRAVPLILSAFKEYRNIGYSDWDWTDPKLQYFVDLDILALAPYVGQGPQFRVEEILEFREATTKVMSTGKTRALKACTSITNVTDPRFKDLPALLKLMICQAWVYLPEIRNKYMITDINNLDDMPEPLVSSDILKADNVETNYNNPFLL